VTDRVAIGLRVIRLAEVTSTMDVALTLGRGDAPSGTVVVAGVQTRGRGRAGRAWAAPPGSALLCSVLLRTALAPVDLATLPLAIGSAVAAVVDPMVGGQCRLKWPNDLLVGDRKLGGILVQTIPIDGRERSLVVVGIGLNVVSGRDALPDGATSLAVEGDPSITVGRVEADLWSALQHAWEEFEGSGGRVDLSAWRDRAAYAGESVEIHGPDGPRQGTLRGVADDGALLLEVAGGVVQRHVAGDLVRGPRPISADATEGIGRRI